MKFIIYLAILFVICCIVCGCLSDDYSGSGTGQSYTDLINEKGPPRQVLQDIGGGKIMSWSVIPIDDGTINDCGHDNKNKSAPFSSQTETYRINFKGEVY